MSTGGNGLAPWPASGLSFSDFRNGLLCCKRPFATQADRLRLRLVAEALPTAGPVGGLVLCLLQLPNISSILPILVVTIRY